VIERLKGASPFDINQPRVWKLEFVWQREHGVLTPRAACLPIRTPD
jgi:hypothetical protein